MSNLQPLTSNVQHPASRPLGVRSPISKHRWVLALVVGVLILVGPDVADRLREQDKTWAQVRQSGVVRFGMEPSYPPFEGLTTSGELLGLDVDLARDLAARMGLRAEFVSMGTDGFYDALATRRSDAIISALIPDPRRMWDAHYSEPYFDAGLVLVTPKAAASRLGDLSGKTIAVERGSDGETRAEWQARRTVGLRLLTRDSLGAAVQAVEAGQADAALADTVAARRAITSRPALGLGPRQTSLSYVIAARADAPAFLRVINQALAQARSDGALERITARWLDRAP